jgi:phosphotransferase system HPr (HPr) family protein
MSKLNVYEKIVVIENKLGLHARPAALFVELASRFDSDIMIEKDGNTVNAKSIMGIMMLAAACGSKLKISAEGDDCKKAVSALEKLIKDKFNEE